MEPDRLILIGACENRHCLKMEGEGKHTMNHTGEEGSCGDATTSPSGVWCDGLCFRSFQGLFGLIRTR